MLLGAWVGAGVLVDANVTAGVMMSSTKLGVGVMVGDGVGVAVPHPTKKIVRLKNPIHHMNRITYIRSPKRRSLPSARR